MLLLRSAKVIVMSFNCVTIIQLCHKSCLFSLKIQKIHIWPDSACIFFCQSWWCNTKFDKGVSDICVHVMRGFSFSGSFLNLNSYMLKQGTSWNKLEPPRTRWNYLKQAGTIWNKLEPLELAGTTWSKVEPPVTRWT